MSEKFTYFLELRPYAGKYEKFSTRANLVENFAKFQPYGLAFREINKLFRLLLAARPGMGAEQFDKVKIKLL